MTRANPVTRILAVMIVVTPLLFTVDIVSASVCILACLLLAPLCSLTPWAVLRRATPFLLATPIAGMSMLLYGQPGGREYASWGLIQITDNSINLAVSVMLRVIAIGLPVILATSKLDPTDLGDALSQVAHLPSRFVIGAVAGARLTTLFRDDWQALTRARRARGIGDQGKIRAFISTSFALLVLAIRRGAKLATAMEARGFGGPVRRTWARPSTVGLVDAVVLAVAVAIPLLSLGAAYWAGTLRWFGLS